MYHVAESDQSAQWTVTYNGDTSGSQNNTVDSGEAEDAGVVNTLNHGDLTIDKEFDWQGVPVENRPTVNFVICIQGPSFQNGTETGACKTGRQLHHLRQLD